MNGVVPYGIMPNTRYQLVVQSGGNVSVPQNVLIGVARPAVFTIDASGQGQGQIYWYDSKGDQILAGPNSPATTGGTLVIYCSGLGEVSPPLTVGTATPTWIPDQYRRHSHRNDWRGPGPGCVRRPDARIRGPLSDQRSDSTGTVQQQRHAASDIC